MPAAWHWLHTSAANVPDKIAAQFEEMKMAKGKLFEYAILYHPREKKDAAGNPTENKKSIIVQPLTPTLAGSDKEVAMVAAKAIPDEYMDKLEDVEIAIRPF